jgi:hypothetical protein
MLAVDLNFYALRKDGEYCGASLWSKRGGAAAATFSVCQNGGQSRLENSGYLYERKS